MKNYKKIAFLIGLIVIGIRCHSQRYFNELIDYNTQNFEAFSSVVQLKDTGYIAIGFSYDWSGTGGHFFTARLNKYGQKMAETYILEPLKESQGMVIKPISDSTFIVCGIINDLDTNGTRTNRDMYLTKLNTNTDTLWTKRFGLGIGTAADPDYEIANDIVVTSDKGYVMTGFTSNVVGNGNQVYLLKTDSSGNFLWQQTFGGNATDVAYSVIETQDKGFLLAGYTYSYGNGDRDGYLIKTDSLGNFQWQKTYGGAGNDGLSGLCKDINGGYLLAGWYNFDLVNSLYDKPWLIKVNDSGIVTWNKMYGGNKVSGYLLKPIQNNDSTIVLSGGISDTLGMSNAGLLLKTNKTGDSLWAREYKRTIGQDDYFNGFCATLDRGYIIAGQVNQNGTPTNTQDGWLIKVDCMGADSITYYFGDTCYTNPIGIKEIPRGENKILLLDNYPNPFNESTVIPYYLPETISNAELIITDITGREIQRNTLQNGMNSIEFKSSDMENGIYYYTLIIENKVISAKKMVVLK